MVVHWLHAPKVILHKSERYTFKNLSDWSLFISIITGHSEGVPFPKSLTSAQISREKIEGLSRNQKVKGSASCNPIRIRAEKDFRRTHPIQHCHFSEEETEVKSWSILHKDFTTLILSSGAGTKILTPDTLLGAGPAAPHQILWHFSARWRSQKNQRWYNFPSLNDWIEGLP